MHVRLFAFVTMHTTDRFVIYIILHIICIVGNTAEQTFTFIEIKFKLLLYVSNQKFTKCYAVLPYLYLSFLMLLVLSVL